MKKAWLILLLTPLLLLADRRAQLMKNPNSAAINLNNACTDCASDPSGSNTLFARWESGCSPAATNVVVDNNNPWIDCIQSILFSDGGTHALATNAALGMQFVTAGSGLTNAPLSLPSSNHTVCVIFRPRDTSTGVNSIDALYGHYDMSDATQGNAATRGGFSIRRSTGVMYWGQFFAGGTVISGALVNNNTYDVIGVQSGGTMTVYTNGVQSASISTIPPLTGWPWRWVANDYVAAVNTFDGWVKQVIVWSNSFSSVQISNVHYYATNKYGYSP